MAVECFIVAETHILFDAAHMTTSFIWSIFLNNRYIRLGNSARYFVDIARNMRKGDDDKSRFLCITRYRYWFRRLLRQPYHIYLIVLGKRNLMKTNRKVIKNTKINTNREKENHREYSWNSLFCLSLSLPDWWIYRLQARIASSSPSKKTMKHFREKVKKRLIIKLME